MCIRQMWECMWVHFFHKLCFHDDVEMLWNNLKSHLKCTSKRGKSGNTRYLFLLKRHKNWYNVFNGMLVLYSTLKAYHNFNLVNLYWHELIKDIMVMPAFDFKINIMIAEVTPLLSTCIFYLMNSSDFLLYMEIKSNLSSDYTLHSDKRNRTTIHSNISYI